MTETDPDLERRLQQGLEALYRIDDTPRVCGFRLQPHHLDRLQVAWSRSQREGLFISQRSDDDAEVGLYIEENTRRDAIRFLRDAEAEGLDGFAAALEGVSHFVYLTHTAGHQERGVSAIEMELQAEVDKFVVLRVWLRDRSPDLIGRLFERFELHPSLPPGVWERYVVANREARRFARWFDHHWDRGRGHHAMNRARALYRRPLAGKLEVIAAP